MYVRSYDGSDDEVDDDGRTRWKEFFSDGEEDEW
jgi:hypothetical protein